MYLTGKVQTARIAMFHDGIEVAVLDKDVVKPMGGRPQYNCKIMRGWQGVDDLRAMKKQGASDQDLAAFSAQIPLPQEDDVLALQVFDISGKGAFRTLLCELIQQP